jgi:hypothetical protein
MKTVTTKPQTFFEGRLFVAKSNGQTAVWEVMHRENDVIHTQTVGIIPNHADVKKVLKGIDASGICTVSNESKYYQIKKYTKKAIVFLCSKRIVRPVSANVKHEHSIQLDLFGMAV